MIEEAKIVEAPAKAVVFHEPPVIKVEPMGSRGTIVTYPEVSLAQI